LGVSAGAAVGAIAKARSRGRKAKRPNILFVFDDQHRHSALGCYGNGVVQTPNLDRLAGQGIVFENAFSSCPICAPFRGQMLTGRYSHANGVVDNEYRLSPGQSTLARELGGAGYRTAFIGKWHLGYGPYTADKRHGFDYIAANNCEHDYYNVRYYANEAGPIKIDAWAPAGETDQAIAFIDEHVRSHAEKPFFLMLGWGPPHWTGRKYDVYPREFKIYDPAKVDLPPNVPSDMESFARNEIAHYYGMVTALDHEFGRLIDALERSGQARNTIVVFTSDHGDHLSSHGYGKPFDTQLHHAKRASKATPFNESIHIPLLIRWPGGVRPESRTDAVFSSVDFMPTLLGMCGLDIPGGLQGTDMSQAAGGRAGKGPDSAYLQILGPGWPHRGPWVGFWRGVRTRDWVYARWKDNECGPMLFNCAEDPFEMNNLAGVPQHAARQRELEAKLQDWMKATGDAFESGARDRATGMLALGQEFTHERWKR